MANVYEIVADPLSEVTRKKRRALLGVSMLSFALEVTNLMPTEIQTLGLKFEHANQKWLFVILVLILGYLFVAFLVYGLCDYLVFRLNQEKVARQTEEEIDRSLQSSNPGQFRVLERISIKQGEMKWLKGIVRMAQIRCVIEFALPIIVGIITLAMLIVRILN